MFGAFGPIGSGVAVTARGGSTLRLVASGTAEAQGPAALGTGNTLIQYRSRHVVMADCTAFIHDEPLYYVDPGTYADVPYLPDAGAVFNMAVEIGTVAAGSPTSQFQPAAFSGRSSYVSSGAEITGWFSTDSITAASFGLSKFTKGDILWFRRAWQFAATRSWLANDISDATNPAGGESVRGATDASFNKVNGTGAFTGTAGTALASSRFLRPYAVRAVHNSPAVLGLGDSIMDGKGGNRNGDGSATNVSGGCYVYAFYNANVAFHKAARDGNTIANLGNASKMPFRLAALAAGFYTHALCNAGTNDIGSASAATAITRVATATALWKTSWPGLKVVWDTCFPRTTSTDAWATTTNQSAINKNGANQFGPNPAYGSGTDVLTAFRAGVAGLVGTSLTAQVNGASAFADPTLTYLLPVTGAASYASTDGTHPTNALQVIIGAALASQLPAALAA